jgi:hypothetical protein
MRPCWTTMIAFLALTIPGHSLAQQQDASMLPVVTIDGPTVILFWTNPDSVSDPDARQGLYSALDQQQTTMADTRDALNAMGVSDLNQAGRQFRVHDGTRERVFTAPPDSLVVGYLLAAPGRDHRALYRVQFTDALLDAVRSFLGIDADGAAPGAR